MRKDQEARILANQALIMGAIHTMLGADAFRFTGERAMRDELKKCIVDIQGYLETHLQP